MNRISLCALAMLTMLSAAFAQVQQPVKLSDARPSENQKITLTYDPRGTPLEGKTNFTAGVYFFDDQNFPVADLDFKPAGQLLQASFFILKNAKAFSIKLGDRIFFDNNNGKGYVYPVYKLDKVVPGAYAAMGDIFSGRAAGFGVEGDLKKAKSCYEQEYKTYPYSKAGLEGYIATLIYAQDKAKALTMVKKLIATGEQERMAKAVSFYRNMGRTASADSLNALIGRKFPQPESKRKDIGDGFLKEPDPVKKEAIYKNYLLRYPEMTKDSTEYDRLRANVAAGYLLAGVMKEYDRVLATVKDKTPLAGYLAMAALVKLNKGGSNLDEVAVLYKQAMDIFQDKIDHPGGAPFRSPGSIREESRFYYDLYADSYVSILVKQGKFEEAVRIEKPVYERSEGRKTTIMENYAQALLGAGKYEDALSVAAAAFKIYNYNPELKAILKTAYIKLKGSEAGFDEYFETVKHGANVETRTRLAKEMVNLPGPHFSLKDLDGNTVSLAGLKGKVVVLDFWATWCGPCKASFPGMQLALNKYKDDPNVKFLFIDVWESDEHYVENIRKYLAENNLTFHVLLNVKGEDNPAPSKLTDQLEIKGIPAKFVLDRNGNIRFRTTGNAGTPEALAEEVSAMIELAAKAEDAAPAGSAQK